MLPSALAFKKARNAQYFSGSHPTHSSRSLLSSSSMMQFKLALVSAFIAAVSASPALIKKSETGTLDVWSPRIISPNADTVWTVGSTVNVTWDTSDAPVLISNGAAVTLNKEGSIASEGFLAPFNSFDLRAGFVEVTIPDVSPGDDYSITLFGDSGNTSPDFEIVA